MRTFYFNTGVRPYAHNPPVKIKPGHVIRGGTMQIPFDCEGVPDNAIFEFASDNIPPHSGHLLRIKIHNSALVSKYAFFFVPKTKKPQSK